MARVKLSADTLAKIRYRWLDDLALTDWLDDHAPRLAKAWYATWSDGVELWIERHIWPRICAHEAIADQCGIPDHDYCHGCDQLMPGMAPRRHGE